MDAHSRPTPDQQFCPYALPYVIRKVPVPTPYTKVVNLNYAAEITIRKVNDSIFHARIYSRAYIANADIAEPRDNSLQIAFINAGTLLDITSNKPLSLIKTSLVSTEEIRIKCVNQEN